MSNIKRLFTSMFKIGMIGFGGGNALIPVIEKTVVEENKLVSKEEYEEDIVVASITPGALPIELAGGVGRRCAGRMGLILGAVAMAAPGVILTIFMLSIMSNLNEQIMLQIEFVAIGVTSFIACLLTQYIIGTYKAIDGKLNLFKTSVVVIGVFVLTCGKNLLRIFQIDATPFFALSTVNVFVMAFFVIFYTNCRLNIYNSIISAAMCILYVLCVGKNGIIQNGYVGMTIKIVMLCLAVYGIRKNFDGKFQIDISESKKTIFEICVLLIFSGATVGIAMLVANDVIPFWGRGVLSSIMSFGGGDAYLTVADGLFVHSNIITEDEFYSCLVPVVNILPGSILCKTLSGVGYYLGYNQTGSVIVGCLVALVGFACSIMASCGVFSIVGCVYSSLGQLNVFRLIKKWIRPIVAGLMITVILSLIYQSCKLGSTVENYVWPVGYMILLYVLDLILYQKIKMKNSGIVFISAILSFTLCNLTMMI